LSSEVLTRESNLHSGTYLPHDSEQVKPTLQGSIQLSLKPHKVLWELSGIMSENTARILTQGE
jgi:hypothetical protein